jgi:hypothetical protein
LRDENIDYEYSKQDPCVDNIDLDEGGEGERESVQTSLLLVLLGFLRRDKRKAPQTMYPFTS